MESLPRKLKNIAHCLIEEGNVDFLVLQDKSLRIKALKCVRLVQEGDDVFVTFDLAKEHRSFVGTLIRDLRQRMGDCLQFHESGVTYSEPLEFYKRNAFEHCQIPVTFPLGHHRHHAPAQSATPPPPSDLSAE